MKRFVDLEVRRFLQDPLCEIELPYAQQKAFLSSYLRHSVRIAGSNPAQGRGLVDLALQVICPRVAGGRCQTVLARAVLSGIDRMEGHLERADRVLDTAFDLANGHPECLAHLYRRRALVRRDQKRFDEGVELANLSVGLYDTIRLDVDHEPLGDGRANAFLTRGLVYYEAYLAGRRVSLSDAVADVSHALTVIRPDASPILHRDATFNLAVVLSSSTRTQDLCIADRHLRRARRFFKGIREVSQERAKLGWLTAMVRHQLGSMRPYRVRQMLSQSLEDFVQLNMPQEGVAVVADMARIAWLRPDYRERIAALLRDARDRISLTRLDEKVCDALHEVRRTIDDRGWTAHENMKVAIEGLREACGPRMIACLITWD